MGCVGFGHTVDSPKGSAANIVADSVGGLEDASVTFEIWVRLQGSTEVGRRDLLDSSAHTRSCRRGVGGSLV